MSKWVLFSLGVFLVSCADQSQEGPGSSADASGAYEAAKSGGNHYADLNGDERVDCLDLKYIKSVFFSQDRVGDINKDGWVNFLDLAIMKRQYMPNNGNADVNRDGFLDLHDVDAIREDFFGHHSCADINDDGRVNFLDLALLKQALEN